MGTRKVGILIGSLRRDSFCRKMAGVLASIPSETLEFEEIDIGNLAIYNQDFDDDGNPPEQYTAFRERLSTFDAFLFVTPEYNRSVPAVLKNALDVGSRPFGKNKWNRKPAAVISVSPGAIGGFGANHHLRQSLACLNVPTMPGPEAYIGNAAELFDDKGAVRDEKTYGFLAKFMGAFAAWTEANARV